MNHTCGSSQVIRKLSFFCLQVPNEVYVILSRPVQTKNNVLGNYAQWEIIFLL